MNNSKKIWMAAVTTLVMVFALGAVAEQLPLGTADQIAGGDTYDSGATVTYTPSGAAGMTVSFGQGSFPPSGAVGGTIVVDGGVEDSPFHGNLVAASINTLKFTVSGDGGEPTVARVQIRSSVGQRRKWLIDFTISRTPGETAVINLPLTIAAGWGTQWEGNADAMLAEDLQSIESVFIKLTPGNPDGLAYLPAQAYTISDVVVVNDDGISSPPGLLTPLEEALIGNFGYGHGSVDSLTADMKGWDKDGDGMADYVEIWAENDEDYANSIFAADDIAIAADGVEITWVCVAGEAYTVLRSDTMYGTFSEVTALSALVASETGYMTEKDAEDVVVNGEGPFFYRIRKD